MSVRVSVELLKASMYRSKNLLAVIQAMARQTARYSGSTESFLERFNERLQALATSHDILFKEEWQSASLADLVRLQLGPYLDRRESQVSVEGPTVLLKPDAAQNLGFALHELATNAAKYGALSVPEGRLSIAWRLLPEADGNGVELDWVESCGPAVVKPAHRGFGARAYGWHLYPGVRETCTRADIGKVTALHFPLAVPLQFFSRDALGRTSRAGTTFSDFQLFRFAETRSACPFPPKADIRQHGRHVRFV
jgi:two-component sensor histidine kinase